MGCYTYDNGDNILTKKTYAYTIGTVGTAQSTVNYGYGNSNWKDQLTSYNGTAITYDASGNPLNWRNVSSMNWTGRQLDSMTLTNGTNVSFQYNSDGLRVSKTVGSDTVKYRWDGTTLLAEEHDDYTITFLYDGDTLIGFNYSGNNYYYAIDNLGVIHYVYNEAGTVVVTYTYDAWGNTISASGNSTLININPIRYKSYYYDSETGLFYLQSRYYDSIVGRFVNADDVEYWGLVYTIPVSNVFEYCHNNPISMIDQNGKWAERYSGFDRSSRYGFSVKYSNKFLSKLFCLSYATNIVSMYGGWSWKYGWAYKRMTPTRIAKELFAHAILYAIGNGLIRSSSARILLDSIVKILDTSAHKSVSKLATIDEKIAFIEFRLGYYLWDHSRIIDVNYNEKWYRIVVFELIWGAIIKI